MRHGPLVSCETLYESLSDPAWVVFDCRHDLMDPQAGPLEYAEGHIPGAFHAHIDRDLSAPVGDGTHGRHPLPDLDTFAAFLARHGVDEDSQIVAYDHGPGMWAGRLWWLARHIGLKDVAVLDGGLARWKHLGLPTTADTTAPRKGTVTAKPGLLPTRDLEEVLQATEKGLRLVDAREAARYEGRFEPVDPEAGHIPGAINRPFMDNLGTDGMFLSPDELAARFQDLADGPEPVMYCGSGVTAAHNVLAMEVAGLPVPALYPGSWSQWCHPDGGRPVGKVETDEEE